ncbi:hypothetical protein MA16_Dca028392 [Dendrobium catenatum]|uniref:Uncharacterized protein n=1 Tax=Dendrobium catenatum TaxID=906689 RepID=A0A2I0VHE3_9ASPA|nr:hypothetical protein MA16_Dca028392 [Dendrobium catenatum]
MYSTTDSPGFYFSTIRSPTVVRGCAPENILRKRFSRSLKVFTDPLGRSAYHSKAMSDRLLTNWQNSRASDPPALQQLDLKWARCCLGFSIPVKILKVGGTKPFG